MTLTVAFCTPSIGLTFTSILSLKWLCSMSAARGMRKAENRSLLDTRLVKVNNCCSTSTSIRGICWYWGAMGYYVLRELNPICRLRNIKAEDTLPVTLLINNSQCSSSLIYLKDHVLRFEANQATMCAAVAVKMEK